MERMTVIVAIAMAVALVVGVFAVYVVLDSNDGDGATNVVYYTVVPPASMKGALAAGQIDGYIAWEPFVSDSVVGGVGKVLEWSEEIAPNHPCCVVAVHNPFVSDQEGQELAARFMRAHMDATDWINAAMADKESAEYDLLKNISVEFTMRNESVVEEALQHMQFRYVMDDQFSTALENFTGMYMDIGVVDEEKIAGGGYENVTDFIDHYVNESYLGLATSVEPSDTILNPDSAIRLGFLLGDIHQLAQAVASSTDVLVNGKSMFEDYGLNVENAIGAPFANGGAVMDAFAGGYVDIGYLGSPPAILKHLNAEIDTTIVAQANSEGSAIVVEAGSGITSLEGLAGKTVATPGESSIQFLLLKMALQWEGMELKIKT
ncbi:MAG: ABC transporter substrate-binding protein [Thermoplasmata archaeon]|nr:ABC transporter substrate-binding protein [Thermoplasmata archaeon]